MSPDLFFHWSCFWGLVIEKIILNFTKITIHVGTVNQTNDIVAFSALCIVILYETVLQPPLITGLLETSNFLYILLRNYIMINVGYQVEGDN